MEGKTVYFVTARNKMERNSIEFYFVTAESLNGAIEYVHREFPALEVIGVKEETAKLV